MVVVMVALVLMFAMFVFPRRHAETASRVKCGSNLRQIGQAMRQYAMDHSGRFPRTRFDPDDPTPRFFTGVKALDPFGEDGPAPNDVTAAMWLLLRRTDLAATTFACPLDEAARPLRFADFGAADKHGMSNFPGRRYLSYSFTNPYPSSQALADDWDWTDRLPSDFAIAADINPGTPELLTRAPNLSSMEFRAINSPNHDQEGQNVAFADGSVRFVVHPFSGVSPPGFSDSDQRHDNIYTAGGPGTVIQSPPSAGVAVISPPLAKFDTVLLPTADAPLGPEPSGSARVYWLMIGIPGFALGGIALVTIMIVANRARQRKLERGELPDMPPS